MIVLLSLGAGLLLGWLSGGTLRRLTSVRIHGEGLLVLVLTAQLAVPILARWRDLPNEPAWIVWLASFALMVGLSAVNLQSPGFAAILMGSMANLAVILINGGMPVSMGAMFAAGYEGASPSVAEVLFGRTHHVMSSGDALAVLADVMPLPGPDVIQAAVSVGDVLLACGVVAFLVVGMCGGLRTTVVPPATGS